MNRSASILLVEDDQSMLNGMYDLFQMPGLLEKVGIDYAVDVRTANNGQEALNIMAEYMPDLIVSDIMMPVMDGYEFLNKVQENPQWLHIPFIFLTAKGNREEILDGQLRGANLYITKPFASIELLELIRSQLERSFQRQFTNQQNIANLKKGILQILNHEFRTPLTYVTAYYEMLSDSVNRFPDNHNFQEYLRGIQAGCVRLTKLIEDFILVIELRTGEYKSRYQRRAKLIMTINSLVQTAVQKQGEGAVRKGIEIEYSLSPDLLPVYGEPQGLLAIFERLLNNAIKFTPANKNARIYITTETQDNEVLIAFRDEGIGFPQDIRYQIFDLFFQHNRGVMEQQGAGTGLTVAKGLAELHNGRIEVTTQEGVGSTFTVVLPVFSGSFEKPESQPEKPQATILAVEDEASLLLGLQELLEIASEKYALTVLTAQNGQHGLEVLSQHKPDLIISDIMMPVMDGFEFLQNVRQNPDLIHIPFIFLTAKGERQDRHRGLSKGAEIYLTKPYDSDELLQHVTSQLDQYFQLQSIQKQNFDSLKRGILQLITPDFRLPLTAVQEYSDILASGLENVRSDEDLKRSLRGIQEGSIRLTNLVEDFISLAELKTGETETAYALREQPIYNFGYLLCEISQSSQYINSHEYIKIHCTVQENLPPIYGDAESLRDGIRRLLEVIVKLHTGEEYQELEFSVTQIDDEICCNLTLPTSLSENELRGLAAIFANNDDTELVEAKDYTPSLTIARSYIVLNNGRIQLTDAKQICIKFPVYTAS
ncbi:MAG: response regulator [Ardenticatenaceae bacterium]|nr:response regulator [Ardenticatenaceae bacterium]MCB9446494.1 response regulator [Ardenticatenaceae bacterium]